MSLVRAESLSRGTLSKRDETKEWMGSFPIETVIELGESVQKLETWWLDDRTGQCLGANPVGAKRRCERWRTRKGHNAKRSEPRGSEHPRYSTTSTSRTGWKSRGRGGCGRGLWMRKKRREGEVGRKGAEGIGNVFGTRRHPKLLVEAPKVIDHGW